MQRGGTFLTLIILLALFGVNAYFIYELYGWPPIKFPISETATTTPVTASIATSTEVWTLHTDETRKLAFSYPLSFGTTTPGLYRVGASAIIHFEDFSGATGDETAKEGEATLFITPNRFTAHVLGGLYDPLARSVIAADLLKDIDRHLPIISATNFCAELDKVWHLDTTKLKGSVAFEALSEVQRHSLLDIDAMRSIESSIVNCQENGTLVTFHKTARDHATAPLEHIYGAINFLKTPNASFQLVKRGQTAPTAETLETMAKVVSSFHSLPTKK